MSTFNHEFYTTIAWRKCKNAYKKSVGGLCERCLDKGMYVPGEIVHHKVHLNPNNITDPTVALNWNNLELLCRVCHADEHQRLKKRYKISPDGKVLIAPDHEEIQRC